MCPKKTVRQPAEKFATEPNLEHAAYSVDDVSFGSLPTEAKSFVGALLDFSKQDRQLFASASPLGTWIPSTLDEIENEDDVVEVIEAVDQGKLKL
ncbi:hypothetical protein OAN307_c00270 [Octadecabacter antarcticus 307]|uniref:Uncharacterized protein n=1 Tax=Octadecabacter antarcticus 307 TaxID=391626 RepID=M9QZI5_9RHOB|nr:hypothetical protein [Octadecabacter antarcticus]AGI65804.1 hypothetical protein OAN307_c00270 [Octadecabacter antarcticus 307]